MTMALASDHRPETEPFFLGEPPVAGEKIVSGLRILSSTYILLRICTGHEIAPADRPPSKEVDKAIDDCAQCSGPSGNRAVCQAEAANQVFPI